MIFETERLIVKPFNANNQEEFFMVNGNPEVMKYIRPAKSREQADAFLIEVLEYNNLTKIYGRWAVWQKNSGEFVGSFALIPVEKSDRMQLGYALLPSYWGLGFASELTKAGIEYTFTKTKLDKVYAYTEKENLPSQKVLEKCGFIFNEQKQEENRIILEYVLEKSPSNFG